MIQENRIVIFGASLLGEVAAQTLKDDYKILYFSDNNPEKWDSYFCGVKIISPGDLRDLDVYAVVIASMYYDEISVQLKKLNIENIMVFFYPYRKDGIYNQKYYLEKMADTSLYDNINLPPDVNAIKNDFSSIFNKNEISDTSRKKQLPTKNNRPTVLIIAYIFPPLGGSGVQRTLKFVKYLSGLNWNVVVITNKHSFFYEKLDYSLVDEIPSDVTIIRTKHINFSSESLNSEQIRQIISLQAGTADDNDLMSDFISYLRQDGCSHRKAIMCPDAEIVWALDVLKTIENELDMNTVDILFSTSVPYSDHIIGCYLKNKYNIPWVADFRDEWTNNPYNKKSSQGSIKHLLEKRMESSILNTADAVVVVSPDSKENYHNLFGLSRDKCFVITNGYDEDDFQKADLTYVKGSKFKAVYTGRVYEERNHDNFIKAVNELIIEGCVDSNLIYIELIGDLSYQTRISEMNLNPFGVVKFIEYLPHLESIAELAKGDLLLLPIGNKPEFKSVYSGKIFEYLRIGRPIIALSPKGSVVERLLDDTGCGVNVEYDDIECIKNIVLNYYNKWIKGEDVISQRNDDIIARYERSNLTLELVKIFNRKIRR